MLRLENIIKFLEYWSMVKDGNDVVASEPTKELAIDTAERIIKRKKSLKSEKIIIVQEREG